MRKPHCLILCLLALPTAANAADKSQPSVDEARIQQHITELSKFGANPQGGVSRVAFSDADIAQILVELGFAAEALQRAPGRRLRPRLRRRRGGDARRHKRQ